VIDCDPDNDYKFVCGCGRSAVLSTASAKHHIEHHCKGFPGEMIVANVGDLAVAAAPLTAAGPARMGQPPEDLAQRTMSDIGANMFEISVNIRISAEATRESMAMATRSMTVAAQTMAEHAERTQEEMERLRQGMTDKESYM